MGLEAARIDPEWDDGGRTVSAVNEATRQLFTDWIVSQCGDDEDLIEKVVPKYPPTGKRTLQDNGSWLQALSRPNVDLVNCRSLIFHSECQMRFVSGCIKALLERDAKKIEPTEEADAEYAERLRKEIEGLVWSHPAIEHSWYKNSDGRIFILSPWRLVDYWDWTREPDLDAFELS